MRVLYIFCFLLLSNTLVFGQKDRVLSYEAGVGATKMTPITLDGGGNAGLKVSVYGDLYKKLSPNTSIGAELSYGNSAGICVIPKNQDVISQSTTFNSFELLLFARYTFLPESKVRPFISIGAGSGVYLSTDKNYQKTDTSIDAALKTSIGIKIAGHWRVGINANTPFTFQGGAMRTDYLFWGVGLHIGYSF